MRYPCRPSDALSPATGTTGCLAGTSMREVPVCQNVKFWESMRGGSASAGGGARRRFWGRGIWKLGRGETLKGPDGIRSAGML